MSYDNRRIYETLICIINELKAEIKELNKKIDQQTNGISNKGAAEWLSLEELRGYLPSQPSESTIRRWIKSGRIPYVKNGKRIAFKKSQIDEWIKSNQSNTREDVWNNADIFHKHHKAMHSAPWREKRVS